MSAHTRGPWRELVTRIDDAHGYQICHLDLHGKSEAERDANRRLISAAPELLEALQWREQFEPRGGESGNDRFERIAETFYRDTGHLHPGKDCRVESGEVRREAFDVWMEAGRARVRAAIAKATGSAS